MGGGEVGWFVNEVGWLNDNVCELSLLSLLLSLLL